MKHACHLFIALLFMQFSCCLCTTTDFSDESSALFCRQRQARSEYFDMQLRFGDNRDEQRRRLGARPNLTITDTQLRRLSSTNDGYIAHSCVDLSNNRLIEWPQFNCTSTIKFMNLSNNRLQFWNIDQYSGLEMLDLSNNRLKQIHLQALLRLPRLRVLWLTGNDITFFGMLNDVPSLKVVILSKDRWYAVNNIDFGPNPIEAIMNDTQRAQEFKFTCLPDAQKSWMDMRGCREVFAHDFSVIEPDMTCMACYVCTTHVHWHTHDLDSELEDRESTSMKHQDSTQCHLNCWHISTIVTMTTITTVVGTVAIQHLLVYLRQKNRARRAKAYSCNQKDSQAGELPPQSLAYQLHQRFFDNAEQSLWHETSGGQAQPSPLVLLSAKKLDSHIDNEIEIGENITSDYNLLKSMEQE